MKVPEPAGRVEHALVERVRHDLAHHRPRQPVWGVVLAELPPLVGRDDGLVENRGDVAWGMAPVEAGDPIRHGPDQGRPADFQRPGEEIRFHDARQTGVLLKTAPQQQVGRVVA